MGNHDSYSDSLKYAGQPLSRLPRIDAYSVMFIAIP